MRLYIGLGLLLLVTGCATVPRSAPREPTDLCAESLALLPPDLAGALAEGRLTAITNPTDRVVIPCRVYGSAGTRTPVIMTHGLQSHSTWFAQSAVYLARKGYPVYALDRRGSGLSTEPRGDCTSYLEMVSDLAAVSGFARETHGYSNVLVVGHCFGALPATAYACSAPQAVRGLVLSTPALYTLADFGPLAKTELMAARVLHRQVYFPVPLDARQFSDDEAIVRFIANDPLAVRQATGRFFYEVRRARAYTSEQRGALSMPVFMALAARDEICDNPANSTFFASLANPLNQARTYARARHVLEYSEEREAFFADLDAWIRAITEVP